MLHPVGSAHRYCKVYTDKGFLSCELAGVSFNFLEEQNTYNNASLMRFVFRVSTSKLCKVRASFIEQFMK